jgi:uncharacterized membrane protein
MNFTEKKAVCTEPVTQVLVMDARGFYLLDCMNAYVQETMRQVVFSTGIAGWLAGWLAVTLSIAYSVMSYNIYCYQD